MAGSTRLWERDPDAMADALARHERIIAAAVTGNRGVVVKPRGEGDSAFCVFDDPLDAVLAAVEIQDGMAGERWPTPEPLAVRIALHTGAAIERDDDYFGRVVNRVARLRGITAPGQVLLSRSTADLVVDQLPPGLESRSLGTQRLQDISRPEDVFAVVRSGAEPTQAIGWSSEATPAIPLPSRLRERRPLPFVGRRDELDLLARRAKEVLDGHRRVAILRGEAGIGKTALAAEVAREAHSLGATVLLGRCDEDIKVAYKPFVEALDHLASHLSPEVVAKHSAGTGLARLVLSAGAGSTRPEPAVDDAETERYLLFRAVGSLLAEAATEQPVVVVVDDLQWADGGTLLLFKHLAVRCDPLPMLLIGTVREDGPGPQALVSLLADLRGHAEIDQLPLSGLSAGDVDELVELAAGQALDEDGHRLAGAVYEESDGHPFFATELLRHLGESGAVVQEKGRWTLAGSVGDVGFPDSIRDVVRQRVGRLDSDVGDLLPIAAVIGREFDLDVLARVVGRSEDELLDPLDRGLAAGLIVEVAGTAERFSFSHSLVQHTMHEELSASRRARTHARIVDALEAVSQAAPARRADELAHHALAARRAGDSHADARAVRYCQLAGDVALDRVAPDAARERFSDAWQVLEGNGDDSTPDAVDILIGLGEAQRQSGHPEYRETLLRAARIALTLEDTDRLVRAAVANNRGTFSQTGAVDRERVGILRAALDAIGHRRHPATPMLLAMLASETLNETDLADRMETTGRAVALAREVDDETLARVLALRFEVVWVPVSHRQRLDETAELVDVTGRGTARTLTFFASRLRNFACWEAGRISEADEHLAREVALAEELGQPYLRWVAALTSAARVIAAGRLDEGEDLMTLAFEVGDESGQPEAAMAYGSQLFNLRRQQGRGDELLSALAMFEGAEGIELRPSIALTHVEGGDHPAARHALGDLVDAALGPPHDQVRTHGLCHLAEVVAALDLHDAAAWLHDLIAPWEDLLLVDQVTYGGPMAHHIGGLAAVLGRYDAAERLLQRAEQRAAAIPAPFWVQEARLARARALLRRGARGDRDTALALLDQTIEAAARHGFGGVTRKATAAMAEEG